MGDFETVGSNSWSSLSTVKSVDLGISSKDIIPVKGKIYTPSAKSLFIESLVDQLCKLLERDPHKRRKIYDGICAKLYEMKLVDETYQLEELASLRGHYQHAMVNLLRASDSPVWKIPSNNLGWSRYVNEYEEISFIAAGGFGKVYKAKHRLDQVIYAVKKISVKFQNLSVLIMESNEVKTLAKLNHPNIVQYKAAWLEPMIGLLSPLPDSEKSECTISDSDDILFESSCPLTSNSTSHGSICNENDNLAICAYQHNDASKEQIGAILYVSMQLCDETLREWLNRRNACNIPVNLSLCLNIMIQATLGVEYIHSCNIIHHDIKPSNIFLSNNLNNIQVGDFGLSCCLQGHTHSTCPLEGGRFGTPLYAAPEQHGGKCNLKSDMYSLGILFIELLSVFATEMERVSVLKSSRSGDIPPSVPNNLTPIIKRLISPKAEERPTSSELLKMLYQLVPKDCETHSLASLTVTQTQVISFVEKNEISSVKETEDDSLLSKKLYDNILRVKDKEILELKSMLAEKENEILILKQMLHKNS